MIYFDNSATTPIYPQALDTYVKTSQRIIGNPSSLHDLGSQANRLLQQARKQIAELINVSANEIYFTSGGTEGDNWVLKGTAIEKREFGNHIIISAVEHPAVTETAEQLVELGFELSYAPVDKEGRVKVEELQKLIRKETILVSVMAVNNEVGTIQPIKEISEVLAEFPKIHFHVDAVQAIGKVNYSEWLTDRVDFATFSAHKFHGPRGIGFMYWKTFSAAFNRRRARKQPTQWDRKRTSNCGNGQSVTLAFRERTTTAATCGDVTELFIKGARRISKCDCFFTR